MLTKSLIHNETQNPQAIAETLLTLIQKQSDAKVIQKMGVSSGFVADYLSKVSTQIDRLEEASSRILNRTFRESLTQLISTLRSVVNNVRRDNNDIHEEISLDTVVKEIADAVAWYASTISYPRTRLHQAERLRTVEKEIGEVRVPWAAALLQRMLSNDRASPVDRLALSSVYFKSP